VELSNVAAFTELPDGRVLSGSEGGALLVWDAGLVAAVVTRPGGAPCHEGAVDALLRHEATGLIVSGGGAVLRLWDAAALSAEPGSGGVPPAATSSTASIGLEVTPSAELDLPPGTRVRALCSLNRRTWLVTDAGGGGVLVVTVPLNPLDTGGYSVTRVLPCAAGGLTGFAALPGCHVAVTAGGDGTVRAIDYLSGAQLQARGFGVGITAFALLPPEGARCCVALGFADGSLRRVQRCSDGWLLLGASRPHGAAVAVIAVATAAGRAASVAVDGTAFFFDTADPGQWRPIGFGRLPCSAGVPTCAAWAPGGGQLLVGFNSGLIVEMAAPDSGADNSRQSCARFLH
jgi:hypothetical protein